MLDSWIGQHYCPISLICGVCLGIWGYVEYSEKDHKAAYLSWLWGGLIAIPGAICALYRYPARFLAFIGLLTLVIVFWRQSSAARENYYNR
jgi:hypothetical protein